MSNINETITDIIRKIRAEADSIEASVRGSLKAGEDLNGVPFTESDLEPALDLVMTKRKEADRLEAALEREKAAIEADALAVGGMVEASRATAENSSAVGNAAAKQEAVTASHGLGDAAKLREALKLCVDEMCDRCRELAAARGNPLPCLSGCEPVRKAKFALVKPLRNCDRFATLEDARKEHRKICEEYGACNKACVYKSGHSGTYQCFEAWLFAPATEQKGENDANK